MNGPNELKIIISFLFCLRNEDRSTLSKISTDLLSSIYLLHFPSFLRSFRLTAFCSTFQEIW